MQLLINILFLFTFLQNSSFQENKIKIPKSLCFYEAGRQHSQARIELDRYNSVYYFRADCISCIDDFIETQNSFAFDSTLIIANIPDTCVIKIFFRQINSNLRVYLDTQSEFYFDNRQNISLENNVILEDFKLTY